MTERFVDEAEKQIPPANTWDTLSANQLIDVKIQLEDKLWGFRNQPQISTVLKQSIDRIQRLIAERSSQ